MFQVLDTPSLEVAIGVSLLEHMLRPTMLAKERTAVLAQLPAASQDLVTQFLETGRSTQSSFDWLQQWPDEASVASLSALPQVIQVMRIDDKWLVTEQLVEEYNGSAPISYILSGTQFQALLYTPTMTFIDGFDPASGQYKPSLIPSLLAKRAKASLFSSSRRRPKTKAVQVMFTEDSCEYSDGKTAPSSHEIERKRAEDRPQRKPVPLSSQRNVSETQPQGCCASSCALF